ncbi:uncharacterized protein [Temnothorax nylanderi]|uniref:uncharacterized protein n=1 Tax=Temnothorax nylanderi TaxID=102681 RepID=UPI003A83E43F
MNSSTTMKKLKRLLTLATIAMAVEHHEKQQKKQEKQKRRRRWWTREWILRRQLQLRSVDLTKEQTRMLVLLYQQHPCLYVQKSEDYHNRDKRLKALQTIAQQLLELSGCVVTVDVIKKKIAGLRTQYLEQINKIQKSKSSGAGADDVFKPTWWLFEELSFLAPHVASRKGESSVSKNIVAKSYVDTSTSSQECENDENMDNLFFTDVQVLRPNNSHNISRKDFCNSTPIKTTNSSATTSIPHNETEEMIETQSVHSETSSASGSQLTSGKGSKRKKVESNENTSEAFWTNINTALKDINKDDQKQEDAGLHHWILFLKSEMQCIKDRRRLRRLQINILNLVQEAQDIDSAVEK